MHADFFFKANKSTDLKGHKCFKGEQMPPPLKETLHELVQCTCKCMDSITFQSCNYCESINCSLFVVN